MLFFQKKHILKMILMMACLALLACQPNTKAAELTATPLHPKDDLEFKVAFIGDTGYYDTFNTVLTLIKNEGAEMVLHQGDFDYAKDTEGFFTKIDAVLGPNFPYFASVGNHDDSNWNTDCDNANGCYAQFFKDRMARIGLVPDHPDLNDQMYSIVYRSLKVVFVGQDNEMGDTTYAPFIQKQLEADPHIWKICSWHKNQHTLQLGSKPDEMGWKVYETCKDNGSIIVTAHEHSYHRTKTLINMQNQIVDTMQHPLVDGVPGNPNQLRVEPGRSFVVVAGLGGHGMRNQDRCTPTTYPYGGGPGCNYIWAKVYSSDQTDSTYKYGALFIIFNHHGDPTKAHGYFKTTEGMIVDEFDITAGPSASRAYATEQP